MKSAKSRVLKSVVAFAALAAFAFPRSAAFAAALCAAVLLRGAYAAPQLKTQPEVIAGGEIKAKVLAASEGVPAATPKAHFYIVTQDGERRQVKMYAPGDLWRRRAYAGAWKDRKGT